MSQTEVKVEYWRWPEYRSTVPNVSWNNAKAITAGVDIGSVGSKAAVLVDGELYAYASMRTGSNSPMSAQNAMTWALDSTGMTLEDIHYTVGTGYGRVNDLLQIKQLLK